MKIYITLEGSGGVLDSIALDTGDNDPAEVSQDIWAALDQAGWTLAAGDTIKITEREG
jgi:hypothetical protein